MNVVYVVPSIDLYKGPNDDDHEKFKFLQKGTCFSSSKNKIAMVEILVNYDLY